MLNFILGIIFVSILVPVADELGHLFCLVIEICKAKCHFKITEINNRATELNKSKSNPIGFQARSPDQDN